VEILNLTEILGVWGTAYEHEIYTSPPGHAAAIWAGVTALFIAAAIGVAACLGALIGSREHHPPQTQAEGGRTTGAKRSVPSQNTHQKTQPAANKSHTAHANRAG